MCQKIYDTGNETEVFDESIDRKSGSVQSLIIIQFAVCLLIVLVLLFFKCYSFPVLDQVKEWYYLKLNDSILSSDESEHYRQFGGRFVSGTETLESRNVSFIPRDRLLSPLFPPLSSGTITSKFGWREDPFLGRSKQHLGIDIAADRGSNVYAVLGGTVEIATENVSYGKYIVLDHGNGIKTLYAHCDSLLVQPGKSIDQGAVIALVGSTGRCTGSHLHFEYILDGKSYDPEPLLKGVYL